MTDAALVERLRAAGCVFAEDEAALLLEAAAGDGDELRALADRRCAGEPLEHVVGWAQFRDLRVRVTPGVFVPRPRTEALVERAIELVRDVSRPVVVDVCCGSGALGAAVATELAGVVELHATDIDPVAVACARENVEPLGGQAYVGDLVASLPEDLRGRMDLLLANVPYVPSGDVAMLPREARDHEPLATLDGGADGLDLARRVLRLAPDWLAQGGHVLIEVTPAQVPALVAEAEAAGLEPDVYRDEEWDATVVTARASVSRAPSAGRPRAT